MLLNTPKQWLALRKLLRRREFLRSFAILTLEGLWTCFVCFDLIKIKIFNACTNQEHDFDVYKRIYKATERQFKSRKFRDELSTNLHSKQVSLKMIFTQCAQLSCCVLREVLENTSRNIFQSVNLLCFPCISPANGGKVIV